MTFKPLRHRRHHRRKPLNPEVSPASIPDETQAKKDGDVGEDLPLSAMCTGQLGTIGKLAGGRVFVGRLASLGFTPGARVEMIHNYGQGPLIVEIRDSRIALGRGEAERVRVKLNHVIAPEEKNGAKG